MVGLTVKNCYIITLIVFMNFIGVNPCILINFRLLYVIIYEFYAIGTFSSFRKTLTKYHFPPRISEGRINIAIQLASFKRAYFFCLSIFNFDSIIAAVPTRWGFYEWFYLFM